MCFFQWDMGQADKWMETEWDYILDNPVINTQDSQLHWTHAIITHNTVISMSPHFQKKKMKSILHLLKEALKSDYVSVTDLFYSVNSDPD